MALGSPRSLSSVTLDRGSLQRGMLPFVFLSPFIMLQYFVIITKIDGTPSPLIRGGEPTQELGGTNASNLPILGQTPLQQLLNTPHSTPLIVTESQKGDDFCRLDDMRIPYREQADLDLEPWRTEGISADFLQTSAAWYRNQSAKMGHLFHIRNNRIYVSFSSKEEEETYLVSSTTKYQNASPRSRGMLALLLLYTCLVQLPDLDGFLTFDDRAPGSMKFEGDAGAQQFAGLSTSTPPPFFTFQKRRNETGILLPWYSHAEFNLSKFLEQAKKDHPWDSKDNRMFWRGASTGGIYRNDTWRDMPRAKLVLLCMEDHMKELCEAAFSAFIQTENANVTALMLDILEVKPTVPLMDQMHFKYLPLLNGNGPCSGRSEKFFSGNSLILKEESDYIEFYYRGLHPNKHYIPIHSNMSNVKEQIEWAKEHDTEAKQIVSNMNDFAKSIQPASVACYVRELLEKYAKLLRYTPKPVADLGLHVHQVFPFRPQPAYPDMCPNAIYPCDVLGLEKLGKVFVSKNVNVRESNRTRKVLGGCQWSRNSRRHQSQKRTSIEI